MFIIKCTDRQDVLYVRGKNPLLLVLWFDGTSGITYLRMKSARLIKIYVYHKMHRFLIDVLYMTGQKSSFTGIEGWRNLWGFYVWKVSRSKFMFIIKWTDRRDEFCVGDRNVKNSVSLALRILTDFFVFFMKKV